MASLPKDQKEVYEFTEEVKGDLVKQEAPDTGNLTKEEIETAEAFLDTDAVEGKRLATVSKKSSAREARKVIEQSDVLICVLDARDPEGTRCHETEQAAKEASKKLIYVLNKSDLIPVENLQAWLKHYKTEKMLTVPFQSIGFKKPDAEDESRPETPQDKGKEKLMELLFKYARKFAEKREQENIVAGVIGFTNVGKSSLINVLKGKIIVPSGSSPFITRASRPVRLSDAVTVIDSPGLMSQAVKGSGL